MQCKPDVISICETWIRSTHSGTYNNLDGFKFVSNSRKAYLEGGVVFYVKNSLQFNVINELFVMDEKIFESLFINVQVGKETIVCCTIYRYPVDHVKAHLGFTLQLTECLEKLDARRKCCIFRDFSYDLAKSNVNTHVSDFTEVMLNHNFCSIINKPTRITNTSATVLDHIGTNAYTDHIKSGIIC